MEIGIDSFASAMTCNDERNTISSVDAMSQLLERIEYVLIGKKTNLHQLTNELRWSATYYQFYR